MTIEERLESLEKSNRKLKSVAVLFLLITCAFVTIAAKDNKLKNGNFETIKAKNIEVEGVVRSMGFLVHDKKGVKKVTIDPHGMLIDATEGKIELRNGLIELRNAQNFTVVKLGSEPNNSGRVSVVDPASNREVVGLGSHEFGGYVEVRNKMNQPVCTMSPDRNGKGVISARNREGQGRTLESR